MYETIMASGFLTEEQKKDMEIYSNPMSEYKYIRGALQQVAVNLPLIPKTDKEVKLKELVDSAIELATELRDRQ